MAWRTLSNIRWIIYEADPEIIDEWKWMGTPGWGHDGLVCAADAHKNMVKMIFFGGARRSDPDGLFNAELEGTTRRAIKFSEGDRINEHVLKEPARAAIVLNGTKSPSKVNEAASSPARSGSAGAPDYRG